MRQLSFSVPAADLEGVLDAFLATLPRGIRTEAGDGTMTVIAVGPALPGRATLEAAAGRPLDEWAETEVPADFRLRRAPGGVVIADRVVIRAPHDAPRPGLLDVVVAWDGQGFGSGSHPTTRMCAELLLELDPRGGLLDAGCGIGTLAILGARLGFGPVVAFDRDEAAVAQARRNAARNDVAIDCRVLDAEREPIPYEPTIVVNAPPAVHARVAHGLPHGTAAVVASGITAPELGIVLDAYAAAGLRAAEERRDDDGVWAAARLVAGG